MDANSYTPASTPAFAAFTLRVTLECSGHSVTTMTFSTLLVNITVSFPQLAKCCDMMNNLNAPDESERLPRLHNERGRHKLCSRNRIPAFRGLVVIIRQRWLEFRFYELFNLQSCADHGVDERTQLALVEHNLHTVPRRMKRRIFGVITALDGILTVLVFQSTVGRMFPAKDQNPAGFQVAVNQRERCCQIG